MIGGGGGGSNKVETHVNLNSYETEDSDHCTGRASGPFLLNPI